jgi:hypothetical protein
MAFGEMNSQQQLFTATDWNFLIAFDDGASRRLAANHSTVAFQMKCSYVG